MYLDKVRATGKSALWSTRRAIEGLGIATALCAFLPLAGFDPVAQVVERVPDTSAYDCAKSVNDDLMSLACNAYFEARNEPVSNNFIPNKVAINRATDPQHRWPRTIHEVIWQPAQFSWTAGQSLRAYDREAWQKAMAYATLAMAEYKGQVKIALGDKTYDAAKWYNDHSVVPWWAPPRPTEDRGAFAIYDSLSKPKVAQALPAPPPAKPKKG